MVSDPIIISLLTAIAFMIAWVLVFHVEGRTLSRIGRSIKCMCGKHAPSGVFVPAVGGRDIQRCLYCDDVVVEVKRTKESIRRVR
jgi:hypothetical protein